jgi:hypothetical protein
MTKAPIPWTRRQAVVGGASGLTAAALALPGCKDDPTKSPATGGTDEADGPVSLDAARVTAALTAVLDDSPWADRAADFAAELQGVLDQLRVEGMDATADTLATGANDMLAPFADIASAAIAMTDDPTALQSVKVDAFQSVLDARDLFVARLPTVKTELAGSAGGDTVPAVSDESVFDELKAVEQEARAAMSALEGGAGNGPANAVLRGMQQFRAQLRGDRSVDDITGRLEDNLTGLRTTLAYDTLRQAAETEGAAPPPDAAEDFLNDVCFAVGFLPGGPGGLGENGDEIVALILAQLGIATGAANDDTCTLLADGMTVVLALLDMAMVFMELAAAFQIGAVLPSGAGLLFIMFMLVAVWMSLKLMCDAIAIATVMQQCAAGGSR